MGPYDKPETDVRPTQCPKCGNPSTGHYENDTLVMTEYCTACKKISKVKRLDKNG